MSLEPILLAERADFLVVAKPPHLLSHPTRPDGKPTLLGWLQEKFPGEFVALVNRLDRETSGTVLVARSPEAASRLGALTMQRLIHKYYLAVVSGRVEAEHGVIDAPLGRLGISPENLIWLRQGVIAPDDPQGRKSAEARTEYWRLAIYNPEDRRPEVDGYHGRKAPPMGHRRLPPEVDGYHGRKAPPMGHRRLPPKYDGYHGRGDGCPAMSLLRLQAHTGRLHQLRVHLAHIGHPVIGDKIYGPDPNLYLKFIAEGWTEEHQRVLGLSRHALHAHELRFPWQGEDLTFTAPLPDDMREIAPN